MHATKQRREIFLERAAWLADRAGLKASDARDVWINACVEILKKCHAEGIDEGIELELESAAEAGER